MKPLKFSYRDELQNIPDVVVAEMLEEQVAQGNPRNVRVFENNKHASLALGGFDMRDSRLGMEFWFEVLYLEDPDFQPIIKEIDTLLQQNIDTLLTQLKGPAELKTYEIRFLWRKEPRVTMVESVNNISDAIFKFHEIFGTNVEIVSIYKA